MNNDPMFSFTLTMCIAAYISDDPNIHIRKLARKYKRYIRNKDINTRRTLNLIIKSPNPSRLIKVVYDQLTLNEK